MGLASLPDTPPGLFPTYEINGPSTISFYIEIPILHNKMATNKGYKTCTELKDQTPEIIREWERKTVSHELILVKRQVFFHCPVSNILVSEAVCRNCVHNYGAASTREIYCMPDVEKVRSARIVRKDKL